MAENEIGASVNGTSCHRLLMRRKRVRAAHRNTKVLRDDHDVGIFLGLFDSLFHHLDVFKVHVRRREQRKDPDRDNSLSFPKQGSAVPAA